MDKPDKRPTAAGQREVAASAREAAAKSGDRDVVSFLTRIAGAHEQIARRIEAGEKFGRNRNA